MSSFTGKLLVYIALFINPLVRSLSRKSQQFLSQVTGHGVGCGGGGGVGVRHMQHGCQVGMGADAAHDARGPVDGDGQAELLRRALETSATVVGLSVGFVLIALTFIATERYQGERPMIPLRFMAEPSFGTSSLYTLFFVGSYLVLVYYLSIYFQSVKEASPSYSGVLTLPFIILATLGTVICGHFLSVTSLYSLVFVFSVALATVAAGLARLFDIGTAWDKVIGFQALGCLGWGASFQVPILAMHARFG
ncbi:hypothetical protein M9X92_010485 [Pyricularia oryzae]|nr:hypothetical protein M9X92_010485 [Pyricularia oryzae]